MVGKPEEKTSFGRPSHSWENNNKMCVEWINLDQKEKLWDRFSK
jgi:hypothetical protein